MGCPQLLNYTGTNNKVVRGSSLMFDNFVDVDWMVFGASPGQGLQITVQNDNLDDVILYIIVYGDAASNELIGKSYENSFIPNKIKYGV